MFQVDLKQEDGIAVARLRGDFFGDGVDEFAESLHETAFAAEAQVAIDLSGLSAIDSSGLSAMINLVTRARLNDSRIILVAPTPLVAGVFHATRLDTWFDLAPNLADARSQLLSS